MVDVLVEEDEKRAFDSVEVAVAADDKVDVIVKITKAGPLV